MTDTPDEGRGRESQKPTEPPAEKGSGSGKYLHIFDATVKEVFGRDTKGKTVAELGVLLDPRWKNVLIEYHAHNEFPQHPIGELRVDSLYVLLPLAGEELPEGVVP